MVIFFGGKCFGAAQKTVSFYLLFFIRVCFWNIISCQQIWSGTTADQSDAAQGTADKTVWRWKLGKWFARNNMLKNDLSQRVVFVWPSVTLLRNAPHKHRGIVVVAFDHRFLKGRDITSSVGSISSRGLIWQKKIPLGRPPTPWSQESSVAHVVFSVLLLNTDS